MSDKTREEKLELIKHHFSEQNYQKLREIYLDQSLPGNDPERMFISLILINFYSQSELKTFLPYMSDDIIFWTTSREIYFISVYEEIAKRLIKNWGLREEIVAKFLNHFNQIEKPRYFWKMSNIFIEVSVIISDLEFAEWVQTSKYDNLDYFQRNVQNLAMKQNSYRLIYYIEQTASSIKNIDLILFLISVQVFYPQIERNELKYIFDLLKFYNEIDVIEAIEKYDNYLQVGIQQLYGRMFDIIFCCDISEILSSIDTEKIILTMNKRIIHIMDTDLRNWLVEYAKDDV